jgi:23S rRNA pseudouridine2605 synthase
MATQKLQLILRDLGVASRRGSEELIRDGAVTVNGEVSTNPAHKVDIERDHIKVNGKLLRPRKIEKAHILFNKPRFVVSTFKDPQGRPCLTDYIKAAPKGLFPVGRLDFDAEGLMILTNDGALAQRMAHPSFETPRTYMVKVQGAPTDADLAKLTKGMPLGEGERLGETQVTITKRQKRSTWLKVVLFEGKKNEIKRMFLRIGRPVRKLRRIAFGPLNLGKLPTGGWRPLTDQEIRRVSQFMDQ